MHAQGGAAVVWGWAYPPEALAVLQGRRATRPLTQQAVALAVAVAEMMLLVSAPLKTGWTPQVPFAPGDAVALPVAYVHQTTMWPPIPAAAGPEGVVAVT